MANYARRKEARILLHKLAVEITADGVVNVRGLLLLRHASSAVLKDNIIVPPAWPQADIFNTSNAKPHELLLAPSQQIFQDKSLVAPLLHSSSIAHKKIHRRVQQTYGILRAPLTSYSWHTYIINI